MYSAYIAFASSAGDGMTGWSTWTQRRPSAAVPPANGASAQASASTAAPADASAAILAAAIIKYLTGRTIVSCSRFAARSRASDPVAAASIEMVTSAITPPRP